MKTKNISLPNGRDKKLRNRKNKNKSNKSSFKKYILGHVSRGVIGEYIDFRKNE